LREKIGDFKKEKKLKTVSKRDKCHKLKEEEKEKQEMEAFSWGAPTSLQGNLKIQDFE